jgi:hypothetical protein
LGAWECALAGMRHSRVGGRTNMSRRTWVCWIESWPLALHCATGLLSVTNPPHKRGYLARPLRLFQPSLLSGHAIIHQSIRAVQQVTWTHFALQFATLPASLPPSRFPPPLPCRSNTANAALNSTAVDPPLAKPHTCIMAPKSQKFGLTLLFPADEQQSREEIHAE